MTRTVLVVLVSAVAMAGPALERPPATVPQLLRSLERPPTKAQWVAAGGPRVAQTLRAVASTPGPLLERRAALAALVLFDDGDTRLTLRTVAMTEPQPVFRKQALEALGRLLGADAATEPAVVTGLSDEVPMVRRAAIGAVAAGRPDDVRRLLGPMLAREQDDETRALLMQAQRAVAD